MRPPSRRTVLRTLGLGVVSTAGCIGGPRVPDGGDQPTSPGSTATDAPVLQPGETYTTGDGRSVSIGDPAVRPSVITVESVSSTHQYERIARAGSGQYLSFVVTVSGFGFPEPSHENLDEPIPLPLAVAAGGEQYRDPIPVGRDRQASRDHVAIAVPILETGDAAVVWAREDGPAPRWRLGEAATGRLAAAPAFEVRSWTVPEKVVSGESFEGSVTVANVGDRDGRFLATFGVRQGSLPVQETSVEVPAGETRTHTVTMEALSGEGIDTLDVVFSRGGTRRHRSVEVTGGETRTGTAGTGSS